jgi:hypothetical protein
MGRFSLDTCEMNGLVPAACMLASMATTAPDEVEAQLVEQKMALTEVGE